MIQVQEFLLSQEKFSIKLVHKLKITIKSNTSFAENLRINLKATKSKKNSKILSLVKCLKALLFLQKNNSTSVVTIVKFVEFYPSIDRSKIYPFLLGTVKEYENIITVSSFYYRKNFRDRLTVLKG